MWDLCCKSNDFSPRFLIGLAIFWGVDFTKPRLRYTKLYLDLDEVEGCRTKRWVSLLWDCKVAWIIPSWKYGIYMEDLVEVSQRASLWGFGTFVHRFNVETCVTFKKSIRIGKTWKNTKNVRSASSIAIIIVVNMPAPTTSISRPDRLFWSGDW